MHSVTDILTSLLGLYYRPRQAMSAILDRGSILHASLLALVTSLLLHTAWIGVVPNPLAGLGRATGAPSRGDVAHPSPTTARPSPPASPEDAEAGNAQDMTPPATPWFALFSMLSTPGSLMTLVALALLYTPATLFLVTRFGHVGSFGVALRRDFGGLLACTLTAWSAALLPGALLTLALAPWTSGLRAGVMILAVSCLGFLALMVVAVQTVFGVPLRISLGAVLLSWLSLGCQNFVVFLASPFALYCAYHWARGDIGDILGSLGARQSFRRYLEAATLNPRDAEAHYQLGLIHMQRHQHKEAGERFRRAIEIDPKEIDAHFQLARIAREESRWEDAIRHLEAVLAQDPRHAQHEAWREAGAVYLATGSFEHARTVLSRFVEDRAYDPEGLYRLGLAHKGLGETEQARACFERCSEAARTAPCHRRSELRRWRREAEKELRGAAFPAAQRAAAFGSDCFGAADRGRQGSCNGSPKPQRRAEPHSLRRSARGGERGGAAQHPP